MALNQSQYASYKIGQSKFPKVAKQFRDAFNQFHDFNFAIALGCYDILKSNKVKKHDAFDFLYCTKNITENSIAFEHARKLKDIRNFKIDDDMIYTAIDEIYRKGDGKTILKPRRIAYPKITNKEKVFCLKFETKELCITVNGENNTVSWQIDMNNRNVDRVENGFYGSLFWSIVHNIKWGRNEGGFCKTTEESTSDDPYDDRYNHDYSAYYGSIGEREQDSKIKMLRSRFIQ